MTSWSAPISDKEATVPQPIPRSRLRITTARKPKRNTNPTTPTTTSIVLRLITTLLPTAFVLTLAGQPILRSAHDARRRQHRRSAQEPPSARILVCSVRSTADAIRHVLPAASSRRVHCEGQPSWACEVKPAAVPFQDRLGRATAAACVHRLFRHAAGRAALVAVRAPGVQRRVGRGGGRHRRPCRVRGALAVS